MMRTTESRILFLQGPHGPAVRRLARGLAARGASVQRVAFNAGDEAAWSGGPLHRFTEGVETFPAFISTLLDREGISDIVLYGDTRPAHRRAIEAANARGITVHCLEEGYIRPSWITYERGGTNGHSRLMDIPLAEMAASIGPACAPPPGEERWGDVRAHLAASIAYHARLLMPSRVYRRYRGHRDRPLLTECAGYARHAALLPITRLAAAAGAASLRRGGRPYHLGLLQLSFDRSMTDHSTYGSVEEFAFEVMEGFAAGAPSDHLLVFKAHPFESACGALSRSIRDSARHIGIAARVRFLDGGPALGPLLDGAQSAVTVNSTAGQAALLRGVPLAVMGRAVYSKPELLSDRPLTEFFASPPAPDLRAYWTFRQFLLATSQFRGGFYGRAGLDALMARLPDAILDPLDAYDRLIRAPSLRFRLAG